MYVIEFQKRGLPHAHILLILADHDRIELLKSAVSTNKRLRKMVSGQLEAWK